MGQRLWNINTVDLKPLLWVTQKHSDCDLSTVDQLTHHSQAALFTKLAFSQHQTIDVFPLSFSASITKVTLTQALFTPGALLSPGLRR